MDSQQQGWFDRLLSWLGFAVEDDEETYGQEDAREHAAVGPVEPQESTIVVCRPKTLEAARPASEDMKAGNLVLVTLEGVKDQHAARIIDFISGTAYALNGSMYKVGGRIFLFAPSHIPVDDKSQESIREDGSF